MTRPEPPPPVVEQRMVEVFRERMNQPVPLDPCSGGPREEWWLSLRAALANSFAKCEDTRDQLDVHFERAMTGENYEDVDRLIIEPRVEPWMRPLLTPERVFVLRFDPIGGAITVTAQVRRTE